jgi:type IV secretion system protein VirB11
LYPLAPFLNDATCSEILINQPHKVFIEQKGVFKQFAVAKLDYRHLMGLANLIARFSDQRLSEKEPLLSGTLPTGHRIQIILPPATTPNKIVIVIRKQTIENLSLDDYVTMDAFKNTKAYFMNLNNIHIKSLSSNNEDDDNHHLSELFFVNNFTQFLKKAIHFKKNILIAGATSTGKTTLLNACLKEISPHEHIVTLEDVAEIKLGSKLHTALFTSKGLQGSSNITMQDLVQASLRIRPDRIIMGELRGVEALDFINATSTGHDGSISSIHASNPYIFKRRYLARFINGY